MEEQKKLPTNGWGEWSRHVLLELERLNSWLGELQKSQTRIMVDIAKLQGKASMWGAISGAIMTIIVILIKFALEHGAN